jgi:phosphatidate cytidylyltransferase
MLAGWGFMIWMTNEAYVINAFRISEVGFWMLVVGGIAINIDTLLARKGKLIAHSLMGLLYISLTLGLFISLGKLEFSNLGNRSEWREYGVILPCFTIVCMWVNDTMAYIVGSLIGKTPFSTISPKKTWEGTIGGIIFCSIIVGLAAFSIDGYFVFNQSPSSWCFLAAIAAIFGTLGDLFESKLKRLAGVKDSGQMMPGHGGFLDRFDSLLLATPFVWLYVWLFVGS